MRKMCSAARMVRMYARGVREMVERKRCPPGYALCQRTCCRLGTLTHLDEFCTRREKFCRVVNMLDYFHGTDYVKTLSFVE